MEESKDTHVKLKTMLFKIKYKLYIHAFFRSTELNRIFVGFFRFTQTLTTRTHIHLYEYMYATLPL
jgi:hypothetical protein